MVWLTETAFKAGPMIDTERPLKLRFADLKRMQIVGSRAHLKDLIARGTIRPPHKDGAHHQSAAWWYTHEIEEDLERERARLTAAPPGARS
jgi:hypothetical protein